MSSYAWILIFFMHQFHFSLVPLFYITTNDVLHQLLAAEEQGKAPVVPRCASSHLEGAMQALSPFNLKSSGMVLRHLHLSNAVCSYLDIYIKGCYLDLTNHILKKD